MGDNIKKNKGLGFENIVVTIAKKLKLIGENQEYKYFENKDKSKIYGTYGTDFIEIHKNKQYIRGGYGDDFYVIEC